jgi:Domain of unknown function (DUF4157)
VRLAKPADDLLDQFATYVICMRTFALKPRAQPATTVTTADRRESNTTQSHQTDLRRDLEVDSSASGCPSFSYSFGSIPLNFKAAANAQPGLRVTSPNDTLEREADHISNRASGVSGPHPPVFRQHSKTSTNSPTDLARHPAPMIRGVTDSPGQPLDRDVRAAMESKLGHDFARVRIHAGERAAFSARALDASAYTLGQDIVFDSGQYSPRSDRGRRLLAHELVHVVQQREQGSLILARQPTPERTPPDAPEKTMPQQPAAPQQSPAQQNPAQSDLCAKVDLANLQLPRKNKAGGVFFEVTSKGIRFLVAVPAKQESKIRGKIDDVATQIARVKGFASAAPGRVALVIVTEGGSQFVSFCGQSALFIKPEEFTAGTGAHESMHDVTDVLLHQSQGSGPQAGGAKNVLDQVADIFVQLGQLTIKVGKVEEAATNIVDPQILNPKQTPEHPGDNMDEFFSSAVEVYTVYRALFLKKIEEFKKTNPQLKDPTDKLIKLLDDFTGKQSLPESAVPVSSSQSIQAAEKGIRPTDIVDGGYLLTHSMLNELLFPPAKTP